MRGQAPGERRSLVGGRPDQRVAEGELPVDADEPDPLRRFDGVRADTQPPRGGQDDGQVAGALRGRHQQQGSGGFGEGLDLGLEGLLHPAGERERTQMVGQRGDVTGPLFQGERRGQLDERQRVTLALGQDAVPDVRRQRATGIVQQGRRGLRGEAAEPDLGKTGRPEPVAAVPYRQDQRHPLRLQAPRGEQQGVGRGAVQPLGVVDQAQQGSVAGELGQQGQGAETDQEAVGRGRRGRSEPEGSPQGVRLRGREPVEVAEPGAQQQVERGEHQLGLALDAHPAQRPHPLGGGRPRRVVEQRRLADSRRAAEHQDAASALPGLSQ